MGLRTKIVNVVLVLFIEFFLMSVSCTLYIDLVMLVGGLEYSVAANSVICNENFCCNELTFSGLCLCVCASLCPYCSEWASATVLPSQWNPGRGFRNALLSHNSHHQSATSTVSITAGFCCCKSQNLLDWHPSKWGEANWTDWWCYWEHHRHR